MVGELAIVVEASMDGAEIQNLQKLLLILQVEWHVISASCKILGM